MMRGKRDHPAEGELLAWIDGQAGMWRHLAVKLHLRRCADCRARLARIRGVRSQAVALLAHVAPPVDRSGAWARVAARAARAPGPAALRPLTAALAGALPVSLAAGYLLLARDGGSGAPAPADHLAWPHERTGAEIIRDICCADHDGGGPPDDGLFTLSLPGETVATVVIYEDLDGSGSFSAGDLPRYISNGPPAQR